MADKTDKYIRIIISLTVIIILVILIILNLTYRNALSLTKDHFKKHQLLLASQTASGIKSRLRSLVRELDIISRMQPVINMDVKSVRKIFSEEFIYLKKMHVVDIALMNSNGLIKLPFKSKKLTNRDFSFRNYYRRSLKLKTKIPVYEFITFEGIKNGKKGIVIAMPVLSKQGGFNGLVIFVIDIKEFLAGFFPVPMEKTFYWIIDSDLNILYHPEFETGTNVEWITGDQPAFKRFIRSAMSNASYTGDYKCPTGSNFIGSSISIDIGDNKWYAVVSTYEDHVYELLEHITVVYGIISIIAIAVIVFCSVIVINFTKRWNYDLQNEVNERRKIEQALRESEKRFKTIINQASDCILIMECFPDKVPVIVEANIAACEMHGYAREELIGKPISFLDDPETAKMAKERSDVLFREKRIHFEGGHVRKDGSVFPVEVTAQLIELEGRPHIMAIDRDITERKNSELALRKAHDEMEFRVKERTAQLSKANVLLQQEIAERKEAEKKLREQHEFIKNVIDSLTHPFYVVDAGDYSIIMANSAAGINESEGELKCFSVIHKRDEPCGNNLPCTIDEIKKNKKPVILDYTYTDSEGKKRFIQVHGFPIFDEDNNVVQVIEYSIDTTENKLLEDRLAGTQKMESIGRLAGGIAHDFNNILSVILTYCELAMAKIPEDDAVYKDIAVISDASDRASSLIKQLLAFSRKQRLKIKIININEIIKSTYQMLERVIGDDIVIELNLDSKLKNIEADPVQVEQILMNIAVNARDAMPEGGNLFIETSNVESINHFDGRGEPDRTDPSIMISITDTGVGMTGEVAEKIFEPFFTTKDNIGTGLGLATVYGIVKQHRGSISVYSEKGAGTTFKIFFPASAEEADYDPDRENGSKEERTTLTGDETILSVDDEESILKLVRDTLQPLGYKIVSASSGEEAINICNELKDKIDLLLTDVVMPHMKGTELALMIEKKIPSIKILFITGYADENVLNEDILNSGYQFMYKPLTPVKLLKKIREVLDRKIAGKQK